MKTNKSLIALLMLWSLVTNAQTKRKVLFIGNSYTYYFNLPDIIKNIALSKGDTLVWDGSLVGGFTLQNHWNNSGTYTKLKSDTWDVVVIQGHSQETAFSPGQVMSQSYPYAKRIADSARALNPCTEIMLYMTWGRKNGDASNCAVYPPVCTYDGMQARVRQTYLLWTDSLNASCSPVGVAWKKFRMTYPAVDLYDPDQSHPSLVGSYLSACVFYSSIFNKNVIGSNYYSTLDTTTALNVQALSGPTVMDSTFLWNLGAQIPTANFTYSLVTGNTYQFNNTSVNANTYSWSFGSTQTSPQNTFAGSPPYTVTLSATNNCTTTSTVQTINITGVKAKESCTGKTFYSTGQLNIITCGDLQQAELYIYDITGKQIKVFNAGEVKKNMNLDFLQKGIYLARIKEKEGETTLKFLND